MGLICYKLSLIDAFPSNRVSGSSWFNSILSCRIKPILKEDGYIFSTGDNVDFGWFSPPRVLLKKSGCKIPRIELEEMGPSLDLVMRRTHLASDDLYKLSLKQPKGLKPKKKKNISHDVFGTTYGRIHMQKQDLSKLQTRKMKGLKKRPAEKSAEDGGPTPKKSKSAW